MKKYEYKNLYLNNHSDTYQSIDLVSKLNKEGQEGWELISIDRRDDSSNAYPCAESYKGIMKREVPDQGYIEGSNIYGRFRIQK